MDIPLELNDIGIRHGLNEYRRKSSALSQQTGVVGFSAFKIYLYSFGYFMQTCSINHK